VAVLGDVPFHELEAVGLTRLEALMLECSLAAGEYGAADRLYDSLAETYPGMDWRTMATYMIGRVLEHGPVQEHVRTVLAVFTQR